MILTARPADAMALVDRALVAATRHAWAVEVACEAHVCAGKPSRRSAACEKASDARISGRSILRWQPCMAKHGDVAKAAAAMTEVRRTVPGLTIAQLRAKRVSDNPEFLKLAEQNWYEGLRKAGLPEK